MLCIDQADRIIYGFRTSVNKDFRVEEAKRLHTSKLSRAIKTAFHSAFSTAQTLEGEGMQLKQRREKFGLRKSEAVRKTDFGQFRLF